MQKKIHDKHNLKEVKISNKDRREHCTELKSDDKEHVCPKGVGVGCSRVRKGQTKRGAE